MRVAIGSDHAGFELKEILRAELAELGDDVTDYGTDSLESCDYPDIAEAACARITDGSCERGILICGTGVGICIAANKVKGIRCALCWNETSARLAKEHNNANVISMGGRLVEPDVAKRIVDAWLGATFEGGRHLRRIQMLD